MFTSIFAEHNEKVRQAHIKKYGVDINQLTPEEKKEYYKCHSLTLEDETHKTTQNPFSN